MIEESLKDLWWLARNGVTYRSPMSLQAVELTLKRNPQGDYQVCHVRDDGDHSESWYQLNAQPPARMVESRGNTTVFRAMAPGPAKPAAPGPSREPVAFATDNIKPMKTEKSISEKIDDMSEVIMALEEKVDRLLDANDLIKNLEQRERFLRQAEEMVAQKAQALEHDRTELEQLRDELEKRRFRLGSA